MPVETAIIDGEVVALDGEGKTSFGDVAGRDCPRQHTGGLLYYAFDLLYRDGYDLTGAPLDQRKAALADIVPVNTDGMVRYSDHQEGRGPDFFRHACRGLRTGGGASVAKRRDRPYRPGRSTEWLKIKCTKRDEFVVIGFTDPSGTRLGFGALVLGTYDEQRRLHYAGRCGTGFSDALLGDLRRRLDAIARKRSAAIVPSGTPVKDVHWVEPRLVAEVQYSNWTSDGLLRHAAFQGLREDKSAEEVMTAPKPAASPATEPQPRPAQSAISAPARDGSITFEGVRLTHPDRLLYPDTSITKLVLAQYYAAIAGWALPELSNRPLSLVRCPDGQGRQCFYQKHLSSGVPDALAQVEIPEKSGSEIYLVIKDLAGSRRDGADGRYWKFTPGARPSARSTSPIASPSILTPMRACRGSG